MGLFLRFTFRIRRHHGDLWRSLGCPEPFGVLGFTTYLLLVFGLEKRMPKSALLGIRAEALMVRVALLFALTAFAAALASGVLLSVQPYGAGWWHTVARCVKLAVKQRHEPVARCGWSGSGGQAADSGRLLAGSRREVTYMGRGGGRTFRARRV